MKLPIDRYYCHISFLSVIIISSDCKFSRNKTAVNIVNGNYTITRHFMKFAELPQFNIDAAVIVVFSSAVKSGLMIINWLVLFDISKFVRPFTNS